MENNENQTIPPKTGLFVYFREAVEELRRVVWPTRSEVLQGTQTVVVFVLGFTLILFALEFLFSRLIRLII